MCKRYTRKKMKGGFNPFNLTYHVENIINEILKRGMRNFIKKLPGKVGNLDSYQQEIVIEKVLRIPTINLKVDFIVNKIVSQVRLGVLMGINALIGLIPVPIVPGLVRTANNAIYQIIRTTGKIDELLKIKDKAEKALADFTNPDTMLEKMSKVDSIKEMKGHIKDSQKDISRNLNQFTKVGGRNKTNKRVGVICYF